MKSCSVSLSRLPCPVRSVSALVRSATLSSRRTGHSSAAERECAPCRNCAAGPGVRVWPGPSVVPCGATNIYYS